MTKIIEGNAVILVIDVQNDFFGEDAPVPCEGALEIIPSIKRLLDAGRKAGIPVIYTQEMHRQGGMDFGCELDGKQPDHCIEGTEGVKFVEELKPQNGDYVITKPRYSAFLGTELSFILNGLGVFPKDTIIIAGVASNVCVHYTAADAHQRDYRIRVVEECCAGTSWDEHREAFKAIQRLQKGARVTLEEILHAIKNNSI